MNSKPGDGTLEHLGQDPVPDFRPMVPAARPPQPA